MSKIVRIHTHGGSEVMVFEDLPDMQPDGAVEAFARALAFEVAPSRVNVISPGFIDTPMWDRLSEEERGTVYTTMAQRLPVGRVGTAEDCAHATLFLMTNEFVTGTVLHVNGGALLV